MYWNWKTIIEPFKIKSVEPLGFTAASQRKKILEEMHYNLFEIPADKVLIDLLTDSGTSAMSAEQWASIMRGDESYAGARSFYVFQKVVREITGYPEVIPVHQGRAAERILFSIIGGKGKCIPANTHFDTTRANVEVSGAQALDLPVSQAWDFDTPGPFKGDMDVQALEGILEKRGKDIPLVILTVTNNSLGGQPVSMRNIRDVSRVCRKYKVPLFLDAARFAENAYFIRLREPGYADKTPEAIAREMFSHAEGCLMSAKKDALVNIGGFMAMKDKRWADRAREVEIVGEGFPTYGGLAGRDLEAMAQGLREILEEEYLQYRLRSVEYLGEGLRKHGIPIVEPPGGHAVYVNAKKFLPHIPPGRFPAQALACELYLESGVRAVEIGSLMFGKHQNGKFTPAKMELLRLAIPRRVYTQSHIDFVIEVFGELAKRKKKIRGLKILEVPPILGHFTAKLTPV
ncbi:MAG: tryptophanase [Elusimicrobia bacterium]|nr:tryptophanase [Elusimicrobiota bacterium]